MEDSNVIILGGGLSGLTASLYTKAPIYEAANKIGGMSASDTVEGFTFDRGIHILQTENQTILDILKDHSISLASRNRKAYIYSHKSFTAYPFQVNTAGLPVNIRAKCLLGFLSRNKHPSPTNYKEWMYKNIGSGFSDTFLIPYSKKFWTVPPDEMTYEWTGNRVPQPSMRQVIRGAFLSKQTKVGTNAIFTYPENNSSNGFGAIPDLVSNDLNNIHLNHRASKIDNSKKVIYFTNGNKAQYKTLISTIPLPDLIRLCTDAPDNVIAAASRLRTNSIFVVNLGINKPDISDKHWIHFPEHDISCFRLSFPNNLSTEVTPNGTSSISAEIAYSDDHPIDKKNITNRVINDLIHIGLLRKNDPIILKHTYDIKYAYCIYDFNRKESIETVHEWLKKMDIIPSGRYGQWAYLWSHEAMLSGKRAAEIAMGMGELIS